MAKMEKAFELFFPAVQKTLGEPAMLALGLCLLALVAAHLYLSRQRHQQDLERERRHADQTREELERLKQARAATDERRAERRAGARYSASRILVVEDNAEMQLLIPAMLETCLTHPEVKVSTSTDEAKRQIGQFQPELLVLDLNLHGESGLAVLQHVGASNPRLPILVYSGYEEEIARVHTLRRSAGLENLTVLPKGDLQAFRQLVPHLFRRRATDAGPDAPQVRAQLFRPRRDRRGVTRDRRTAARRPGLITI
jgi:CheY-like chemotaxis protein